MGSVPASSHCNALKYHKLSRVKQDHYKERRALKNPPALAARVTLSWHCPDSQAAAQKKQKMHNLRLEFSSLTYYI